MDIAGPLLLQIVLIALNAVFAMAEIAIINVSEAKLSRLQEQGSRGAKRLLKLKGNPAKFLATIQVAITLAGFLGSAFAAENFADDLTDFLYRYIPLNVEKEVLEGISVVMITVLLSYVSLIFGELVPKRIAMRKAEKSALALSGSVYFVAKVFAPIVWFLTLSTNAVLRMVGIDPTADDEEVGEEDIRLMAEAAEEKGSIEEDEREIIENIFEFDDLTVGEITTHRTDVVLLWMEESDEEWQTIIRESRYTMYPICDGSIDNIVGVLDTKDYFRLEDKSREEVLKKAVRTPYFVPEGAKADITFRNMKINRASFAVVLDEYAGFSGIISIKDLVEKIVGDIEDDEAEENEEDEIQQIDERKWRINGNVTLALLSETIHAEFPDDYETISGFVLGLYGTVPEDGSQFEVSYEGMEFQILDVQEHQVVSIVMTLPEKEQTEEDDD